MRKAIVDLVGNINYNSFYIYGLSQLLGKNNIEYSSLPFVDLPYDTRHSKGFLFVIKDNGVTKKYYIHTDDAYSVDEVCYDWCDVYGNVNANFSLTPTKYHAKMVSLCPSFAIRCWSTCETIYHAINNAHNEKGSLRKYMGKYKRLLQRLPYSAYDRELKAINQQDSHTIGGGITLIISHLYSSAQRYGTMTSGTKTMQESI